MRHLLQLGNKKLGEGIHSWSLPAIETCPGRSDICQASCYATKGKFLYPVVKDKLKWNLEQAHREDFTLRMIAEIQSRGPLVVRVHVSGDFFSKDYAIKWLLVMEECLTTRFYWYSRSWRVPEIRPVLEHMARRSNCTGWMSTDAETGPTKGKQAYLQTAADDLPEKADVVFRVRKLRRLPALPIVCPAETQKGGTCGTCQRCL